jgi:hypothetical protein
MASYDMSYYAILGQHIREVKEKHGKPLVRLCGYAARRRVLAAFLAAWLRACLPRLAALFFAWRESAARPAVERGSFLSARSVARERVRDGLLFE